MTTTDTATSAVAPTIVTPAASLTERYAAVHRTGYDCRVTCVRNLLELHGHRFTYSVLQGLSSTFFFVYRKVDDVRSRLLFPDGNFAHRFWPISGQKLEALENVTYLTGSYLVRGGEPDQSAAASLDEIRPYLDQGVPVMVTVCRAKLSELRGLPVEMPWFPGDLGFGGHWVVVTEIDDHRRVVRLFETDQSALIEMSFEDFHLLRTYGDHEPGFYMKSRNRWAVFEPPRRLRPFDSLADAAIRKTAHELRYPLLEDGTGMGAFNEFCSDVPGWTERDDLPPEKLRLTVCMGVLTSTFMVGGGLGRRSHGMFLRSAGRALGSAALTESARHYGRAGVLWQQLWEVLRKKILEDTGPWTLRGDDVALLLEQLKAAESAGFDKLCEYVG